MKNISISKKSLMALIFVGLISSANGAKDYGIFNNAELNSEKTFSKGPQFSLKLEKEISAENFTTVVSFLTVFITNKENVHIGNVDSVKQALNKVQEVINNKEIKISQEQRDAAAKLFSIASENNIAKDLSLPKEEIENIQKEFANTLEKLQEEIAQNKTVTPGTKAKLISLWGKMKQGFLNIPSNIDSLLRNILLKKTVDLNEIKKELQDKAKNGNPEAIKALKNLEVAKSETPVVETAKKPSFARGVLHDLYGAPSKENKVKEYIKNFAKKHKGKITAGITLAIATTLAWKLGVFNTPMPGGYTDFNTTAASNVTNRGFNMASIKSFCSRLTSESASALAWCKNLIPQRNISSIPTPNSSSQTPVTNIFTSTNSLL